MRNNGVVTIFRPDKSALGLTCLGTVPAWTSRKMIARNDGAGTYNDDRFDIRVGIEHLPDVRTGDLVFFGRAESACVKASECRRISSVTKNSFGTTPHWHLAAEYRYR
ncbi:MAG: hypothetical protein IKW62_01605 [Clostridia bacterium]|nr:hypothetical protein [Clostridia bacterium]